jgi:hypothetical protein
LFGPKNQVGYGLSFSPQNRWEDEDDAEHASRFSGLFYQEVSRGRIFQISLKTGRGTMWMVHVISSRRSCGDESEDGHVNAMGCIGLFYSNFIVFVVLGHKSNLVFLLNL